MMQKEQTKANATDEGGSEDKPHHARPSFRITVMDPRRRKERTKATHRAANDRHSKTVGE